MADIQICEECGDAFWSDSSHFAPEQHSHSREATMDRVEKVARALCWNGTLRAVGKPCPNEGCQSRQTCAAHIDGLRESEDWTTAEDAIAALDAARGESTKITEAQNRSLHNALLASVEVAAPETPDERPRPMLTEHKTSPELLAALQKTAEWEATATPEQKAAMHQAQRESWVRGEMGMGETVAGQVPETPDERQAAIVAALRDYQGFDAAEFIESGEWRRDGKT